MAHPVNFLSAKLAGIIFDCDGVMIDSLGANRIFYNLILRHLNLPDMTAAQEAYAFQATAKEALKRMIPAQLHDQIEALIQDSLDYERDVLPHIKLMPGFEKFIDKAHASGLRMAIDTNRTDYGIDRVLDFFRLPQYFNPVISSSNCLPKPSPEGVQTVCATWNAAPDQVLFVGDSEDDMRAAKGAGCYFAAFANPALAGDVNISDFSSLAHLLWPDENF